MVLVLAGLILINDPPPRYKKMPLENNIHKCPEQRS